MSVVGRSDLLGAVFAFSAMSVFHRLAPSWTGSPASVHLPFSVQVVGFVVLVGLVVASILCKETSFMMLPVLAGYFVLLECSAKLPASHLRVPRIPWARLAAVIGPLTIVAVGYLFFRHWITGAGLSVGHLVFRRTENPMAFAPKFLTRFLSKAHVHAVYTGKLLWPAQLSVDYSMDCIPLVESFADFRNIRFVSLYFCLSVAFATTVPWDFLRRRVCFVASVDAGSGSPMGDKECASGGGQTARLAETRQPIPRNVCSSQRRLPLAFCLVWFIGFALPFSNVITDVGTCVAERLLYVPNVAFCYVLAEFLTTTAQRVSRSKRSMRLVLFWALVGATLAVYAIRTRVRCRDWFDEESLFEAAYTVCPRSIKVVQNYGAFDVAC